MNTVATTSPAAPSAEPEQIRRPSFRLARAKVARLLKAAEPHGQAALLLALRLLFGWQFVLTGWGKLTNLERTAGFFESLGLPAPAFMVGLVGLTELVGGVLLLAGFGARWAAAALAFTMGMAYLTAHAQEGFASLEAFTQQAPFAFLVASLIVLAFGAGAWSLDGGLRRLSSRRRGARTGGRA